MRLLIIGMTILSLSCSAQNTNKGTIKVKKDSVYANVDVMPVFPGGESGMLNYISSNIVYPIGAIENGISGTSYITFTIKQDGKVEDVRLLRGIRDCPACDIEALRVVEMMPNFKPGIKEGKVVNVQYNLPIKFRLK